MSARETLGRWRSRLATRQAGADQPSPAVFPEAAGSAMPFGDPLAPQGFASHEERRVVVITRQGCHLCEQAIATLEQVAPGQWSAVDVDLDEQLRNRYTDHVPVTFVDGHLVAYWTLDEGLLRRALAGDRPAPPAL